MTKTGSLQESPAKKNSPAKKPSSGEECPLVGYCPVCQMPLELLAGSRVTPDAHLADCADRSLAADR